MKIQTQPPAFLGFNTNEIVIISGTYTGIGDVRGKIIESAVYKIDGQIYHTIKNCDNTETYYVNEKFVKPACPKVPKKFLLRARIARNFQETSNNPEYYKGNGPEAAWGRYVSFTAIWNGFENRPELYIK